MLRPTAVVCSDGMFILYSYMMQGYMAIYYRRMMLCVIIGRIIVGRQAHSLVMRYSSSEVLGVLAGSGIECCVISSDIVA